MVVVWFSIGESSLPATKWGKCHKMPKAARDDGGENLRGRGLQIRTPIDPPAKRLSAHFPHFVAGSCGLTLAADHGVGAGEATVDDNGLAIDIGALIAAEEQSRIGDFDGDAATG